MLLAPPAIVTMGGKTPFAGAQFWRWRPITLPQSRWDIRTNQSGAGTNGIYTSLNGTGADIGAPLSYNTNYRFRNANGSTASAGYIGNPWAPSGSYGGLLECGVTSASLWFNFGSPVIIGSIDVGNPSWNSHNRFPLSFALEYQESDDYTGSWTLYATLNSASGNATKSYRNIVEGAVVMAS